MPSGVGSCHVPPRSSSAWLAVCAATRAGLLRRARRCEPMISASIGGWSTPNQPEATEPVATRTRSPMPLPSTSKATSGAPPSGVDLEEGAAGDLLDPPGRPHRSGDRRPSASALLLDLDAQCSAPARAPAASAPPPGRAPAGRPRQPPSRIDPLGDGALLDPRRRAPADGPGRRGRRGRPAGERRSAKRRRPVRIASRSRGFSTRLISGRANRIRSASVSIVTASTRVSPPPGVAIRTGVAARAPVAVGPPRRAPWMEQVRPGQVRAARRVRRGRCAHGRGGCGRAGARPAPPRGGR